MVKHGSCSQPLIWLEKVAARFYIIVLVIEMDKILENDDSDGEGVQVNITRLGKFGGVIFIVHLKKIMFSRNMYCPQVSLKQ